MPHTGFSLFDPPQTLHPRPPPPGRPPPSSQAALTSSKLRLTRQDLTASQALSVQQALQLKQQGQQLADLAARLKLLEEQLLEARQQVC